MNKIAEQQTSDDKNSTKVKSEESTKKNGNNDVKKPEQVEFVTPRRYENPPPPVWRLRILMKMNSSTHVLHGDKITQPTGDPSGIKDQGTINGPWGQWTTLFWPLLVSVIQ